MIGTWVAHIQDEPMPEMVRLAQFPTGPTLVITIGDLGAETLSTLEQYMDNCNVVFDYETPNTIEKNYPRFFHIALQDANLEIERNRLKPIVTRFQPHRGEIRTDDWQDVDGSNPWAWLQTLGTLEVISQRAAIRIGFQTTLQRGQADPLTSALRNLLSTVLFRSVLIIASCDENLGTQIIGDLAALIRSSWPHQDRPSIYTIIHGENKDAKTTVSTIEISSLSSYSRLSWGLPAGGGWNLANEEERLIDEVFYFLSTSKTTLISFVWAYLTSEDGKTPLSTLLNYRPESVEKTNMYYIPSVTRINAQSIETPLRFLRDAVSYQAMILLLGTENKNNPSLQGYDLATVQGMNRALEQFRSYGLIGWIDGYRQIMKSNLSQLIDALKGLKRSFELKFKENAESFGTILNQDPLRLSQLCRTWDRSLVDRLAQEVQTRLIKIVGFSLSDKGVVEFWNAAPKPAAYLNLNNLRPTEYNNLVDILRTGTLKLAYQICSQVIKNEYNLVSRLDTEYKAQDFQNAWNEGFKNLTSQLNSLILNRLGQQPHEFNWRWYSSIVCDPSIRVIYNINDQVKITDQTMDLQIVLIARSPISYLRLYQPYDPNHIRNLLVYSIQHVTTDIFGWNHNPSVNCDLQAALTFRRAFKRFAECYSKGKLTKKNIPQLRQMPDFPNNDLRWIEILWEFIRLYQTNHNNFRDRIDELSRGQPTPPAIPIQETTQLNIYLLQAIESVTDNPLSYFQEEHL